MCIASIQNLLPIITLLLGIFVTWFINYSKEKRDRKDRYFFAMLEQRFGVNQQAFSNVEKLKNVIHAESSEKNKVVEEVKKWFNLNNLYLEPEIRKIFRKVIHDVSSYDLHIDDWRRTGKEKGWGAEETQKKEKEIEKTFEDIVAGIQNKIQEFTDKYYKYIA